jgi:hypothetical protein
MATVDYSAFISYSHALDDRLAPALDHGIMPPAPGAAGCAP